MVFIAIGLVPWIAVTFSDFPWDISRDFYPDDLFGRYFRRPPETVEACLESLARHTAHRRLWLLQFVAVFMAMTWPFMIFGAIGWWMGMRASFGGRAQAGKIASGLRRLGLALALIGLIISIKAAHGEFQGALSVRGLRIHTEHLAHTISEARFAALRAATVMAVIFALPFAFACAVLLLLAHRTSPR